MRDASIYLKLLRSLFPRGRVWTYNLNSTLYEFLYGEAEEFARVDNRSIELLIERDTRRTTELLIDHEIDLGLPDDCFLNEILTISQRRKIAHAKLISLGGQTPQFFIDLAADLGYTIIIEEYGAFISGEADPETSCGDNFFIWKIIIQLSGNNIIYFQAGESSAEDYLSFIPSLIPLMCILTKYKPAHTQLLFDYNGPEYGFDFSNAFDSMFRRMADDYLDGSFSAAFDINFDIYLGIANDCLIESFSAAFDINFDIYWGGDFLKKAYSFDFKKPI